MDIYTHSIYYVHKLFGMYVTLYLYYIYYFDHSSSLACLLQSWKHVDVTECQFNMVSTNIWPRERTWKEAFIHLASRQFPWQLLLQSRWQQRVDTHGLTLLSAWDRTVFPTIFEHYCMHLTNKLVSLESLVDCHWPHRTFDSGSFHPLHCLSSF